MHSISIFFTAVIIIGKKSFNIMLTKGFVTTVLCSKAFLLSIGEEKKKVVSVGIFLDINLSDRI